MARRFVRICINLALVLISVCATVALVEGGARYLQVSAIYFIYPSPANCMQRDPELSLTWRKGCSGIMSKTSFRTNAIGLRGPELRDDNSIRILALGDSCTWGWGAKDSGTYPMVLQGLLDRRFGHDRYQVINAGVPGYTSHQGLVYLRKHRLELHPSIVVAGFGFNDATRDGSITERIASERRVMPFLRTDDFLLYRSYFWRWARSRWHVQRAPDLAPRAEVPIYSKNLAEIVDLVRGRQGKTLLLDFLRTTDNYSKAMHAVAQTEAVPVLVYQGPHADIVHPTPDGYRTLATQVLDRLVAERWVPAVGDRSGGDLSHAVSEKAKTVLASLRPAVTSGLDPQPIRTVAENGGGGGGVGPRQLAEIVRFHRLSEGPRQG